LTIILNKRVGVLHLIATYKRPAAGNAGQAAIRGAGAGATMPRRIRIKNSVTANVLMASTGDSFD
jgi:hypothetical protein